MCAIGAKMKLTIVYDNETTRPELRADWGFSCLIETPDLNLLFDTGANGDILLYNMQELGINPNDVHAVVLSHNHWDNTGGLVSLQSVNPRVKVYHPTFSTKPKKLLSNFMTTGVLDERGIQEQSLICFTNKGLVVITGCSHPGLENVLDIARNYGKIYGVVGGFHGFDKFDALKNISLIVPCHYTSFKSEIQKLFPNGYSKCGAGKVIEIEE